MLRFAVFTAALAAAMFAPESAHAAAGAAIESAGAPPGFDQLARPRQILVDVYFGGSKVGEAMAIASPGRLRFVDPGKLLALLPQIIPSPELLGTLAGDLPTHSDLVCSPGNQGQCGDLSPETAGIIFDEDRFRATLFFAPRIVRAVRPTEDIYLTPPRAPLSLTSSAGFAVSGSDSTSPSYNVQNRTILSLRNARIRADSSYASQLGLIVDDLVGEVDSRDLRYSGGLFWAPGLDLTGNRRIAGIGVGTQFDTRADRDTLQGTPLVVFLQQPARVEMIVDNRLVTSRAYGPGNNILDTSELPSGSYPVLLRIREQDGAVREERRFFVKNAQIAPVGQPLYFMYAGFLANTRRDRPISLSDTFYYQVGTARRLTGSLALDVSAVGAGRKNMVEAGAWLVTRYGRMRVAGLVSTSGDRAVLLQLGSSGRGRLNFNFDLRRVWSSDGGPLIPLPATVDNFGSTAPTGAQIGNGSYTQVSGSIGYALGSAYLSVVGSLRHDRGIRGDYVVGPSLNWPLISRGGIQLALQADVQRTRTTTAGFVGLRAQLTRKALSFLGTVSHATRRTDGGAPDDASRMIGSLSAQYFHEAQDRTQVAASVGLGRNLDSSEVHANGTIYSRFGSARGDLLHPLGERGGLQYGLTVQSSAAVNGNALAVGGRDIGESALVVAIDGEPGRPAFEVLINDQPRGRLGAGQALPIFLPAYREYKVRIRPVGPASVDYDTGAREITLYPGNVERMTWIARSFFTAFGQALRPDGRPVANAAVQSPSGIGETDDHGYFQIDVASGDTLSFDSAAAGSCQAKVDAPEKREDVVPLGKVVCR